MKHQVTVVARQMGEPYGNVSEPMDAQEEKGAEAAGPKASSQEASSQETGGQEGLMRRSGQGINGETQWAVLTTIVDFCETARQGPTLQEIGDQVGVLGRSSVSHHVTTLMGEELVEKIYYKHRSLRPTEKGKRLVELMREFDEAHG